MQPRASFARNILALLTPQLLGHTHISPTETEKRALIQLSRLLDAERIPYAKKSEWLFLKKTIDDIYETWW